MTYTATISSQGQVTIPAKVRRQLGLKRNVVFDVKDDQLILRREPTLEDIQAILKGTEKSRQMPDTEKNNPWAKAAIAKDLRTRGY
jgi:AbrB family looped-hinge helix DNA binding protein